MALPCPHLPTPVDDVDFGAIAALVLAGLIDPVEALSLALAETTRDR